MKPWLSVLAWVRLKAKRLGSVRRWTSETSGDVVTSRVLGARAASDAVSGRSSWAPTSPLRMKIA